MESVHGDTVSYEQCPRAKLFRSMQHTVVDVKSMQTLLRSNGMYLHVSGNLPIIDNTFLPTS